MIPAYCHSQSNWQVEGVKSGLVLHNELPASVGKVLKANVLALKIQELSTFRLEGGLHEQVEQVQIVGFRPKVAFQDTVDKHLNHKSIVDGNFFDSILFCTSKVGPGVSVNYP